MTQDYKYIDDLAKGKLQNYEYIPNTDWGTFQSKFSANLKPNSNFLSGFTQNVTYRRALITVVGLSVLTTGILIYESNSSLGKRLQVIPNVNKVETPIDFSVKNTAVEILTEENNNLNSFVNDSSEASSDSEDFIIRVKIPVHKEIIVKDTIYSDKSVIKK